MLPPDRHIANIARGHASAARLAARRYFGGSKDSRVPILGRKSGLNGASVDPSPPLPQPLSHEGRGE
jgi:hypothetical protein